MSENATTQDQNSQQNADGAKDTEVTGSQRSTRRRPRRATRPVMTPEERAAAEAEQAQAQVAAPTADTGGAEPEEAATDQQNAAEQTEEETNEQTTAEESEAATATQQDDQETGASSGGDLQPGIDVLAEFGVDAASLDSSQVPAEQSAAEVKLDIPERQLDPDGQTKPKKRSGSSRRSTSSGKQAAVEDQTSSGSEASGAQASGKSQSSAAAEQHSGDQDSAAPEERSSGAEADPVQEAPRLPATALLFQAPDPAAARTSRRAGAPAGPPEPRQPAEKDTAAEESEAETQGDQQSSEEGQPPSGGRRRRRGGRGRRRGGQGQGEQDQREESQSSAEGEKDTAQKGDRTKNQGQKGSGGSNGRRGQGSENRGQGSDSSAEGKAEPQGQDSDDSADEEKNKDQNNNGDQNGSSRRRRRRRSRGSRSGGGDDGGRSSRDEVTALKGSTRLEAKRQRRRDGRGSQRRRAIITEAEFLARRESVKRSMVVREKEGRTQVAILEDDVLVEHYVARKSQASMVGNVYLGRVQNVLPSMEAAFIDVGKGRNAVLYAGEVNWDAAGLDGQPRRIEQALASGDSVLVQVTKDPVGHKGARLTSQITLAGRYLVLVPSGAMTGISRKLPDTERNRLKKLLKEIVPDGQGVIVRTAAEGASESELRRDVERLTKQWADIEKRAGRKSTNAPTLLKGEPELATRVVRDVFNEDFSSLTVAGDEAWKTISEYVSAVAPDLNERLHQWTGSKDVFAEHRIDEQLAKGLDRKVWLPSGGSLVIDRTEAMTVVDVNTGKFTGSGGTLEETVTRNNLEAAEEIVRQLRLRDIGGIIVIDFIDMVLEANRDLVLRRLVECLGRDRTRHQVAEVTSLGLVQMTRKRVGQGLLEAFSENCEQCSGRGFHVHSEPVSSSSSANEGGRSGRRGGKKNADKSNGASRVVEPEEDPEQRAAVRATLATIAAAAANAHAEEDSRAEGSVKSELQDVTGTESGQDAAGAESGQGAAGTESKDSSEPADESAGTAEPTGQADTATGGSDQPDHSDQPDQPAQHSEPGGDRPGESAEQPSQDPQDHAGTPDGAGSPGDVVQPAPEG